MSDDRTSNDFERRKFLALIGAAGVYTPPALVALLGSARPAFAGGQSSVAASSTSESSSSSSGPATLYAIGDTFLRKQSMNTNEGANPRLRVGVDPITRALVAFDPGQILEFFRPGMRATLALRIASNHNNWGQLDNRTVDAYPLLNTFVEGNGRQSGLTGADQQRGSGVGATWNTPQDPNVADNSPRHATLMWRGGFPTNPKTAPGAVHVNEAIEVDVTWDVTGDVASGASGWLIKVTDGDRDDDRSDDRHRFDDGGDDDGDGRSRRLPLGFDGGEGGTVEYYSREGAANVGNYDYGPRLYLSF